MDEGFFRLRLGSMKIAVVVLFHTSTPSATQRCEEDVVLIRISQTALPSL